MLDDADSIDTSLRLVEEYKIHELLHNTKSDSRMEASGIFLKDHYYYVVLDNVPLIVKLEQKLDPKSTNNRVIIQSKKNKGFEGISYHVTNQTFLVVVENSIIQRNLGKNENSHRNDKGQYQSIIEEYNQDLSFVQSTPLDYKFDKKNKGFEGISYVSRHGQDYVLGVCEGNKCKGGKKGRKSGNGRIVVFKKQHYEWQFIDIIKLPKSVEFEDYSALDVRNNHLAVVSQASSALWIGTMNENEWKIDGEGQIYHFPKNRDNDVVYCTVEGVTWINSTRLAFVSDKRKKDKQNKKCKSKDQSIHIFELPTTQ